MYLFLCMMQTGALLQRSWHYFVKEAYAYKANPDWIAQ